MRTALMNGSFPGMGTGDPDLYKAFCWRFWSLISPSGGWMGVVLPRSALAAKGGSEFRTALFTDSALADVTMLVNNRGWVFDAVHPQYTLALLPYSNASNCHGPIHPND